MGPFLPAARTRDASQSQQPNDRVDNRTDLSRRYCTVISHYILRVYGFPWNTSNCFLRLFIRRLFEGRCVRICSNCYSTTTVRSDGPIG